MNRRPLLGFLLGLLLVSPSCSGTRAPQAMDCFLQQDFDTFGSFICEQADGTTASCLVVFAAPSRSPCSAKGLIREDGRYRSFDADCYRRGEQRAKCTEIEGSAEWCREVADTEPFDCIPEEE